MVDNPRKISIALGNSPAELLLKEHKVTCPRVQLNFADYPVIIRSFAPMVRNLAFDIGELSLVTFLQALEAGKPLRMLPVIINGNLHHGSIFYDPTKGPLAPGDLIGRRVGVRSYTQTMGMWIRGVLQEQYGVSPEEVTWVCREEAHVAEYRCPPNVEIRKDAKELELLASGDVDAIITVAANVQGTAAKPLLPDADTAAAAWYAAHRTVMVNHMVAVTEEFLQKDPSAVQDVYDMLRKATDMTCPEREGGGPSAVGYGADRIWSSGAIQLAMEYSIQQKLLSRTFGKSDIFAEVAE